MDLGWILLYFSDDFGLELYSLEWMITAVLEMFSSNFPKISLNMLELISTTLLTAIWGWKIKIKAEGLRESTKITFWNDGNVSIFRILLW